MIDKGKRIVANVTVGISAVYGIVALFMFIYPTFAPWVVGSLAVMFGNFFLIPVGIVVALIGVLLPLVALIAALYFVDMLACKLLGIPLSGY